MKKSLLTSVEVVAVILATSQVAYADNLVINGSGGDNPDWHIGRDWTTWARRGYLDFYVPQLYTKSPETFAQQRQKTKLRMGDCDLVTGMAASWSGIYPERQAPKVIEAEIAAARELGAKGFVLFHLDHIQDGHLQAVRKSCHTLGQDH
jgi:uncharacterized lipoprotein YddW (UPF0748 family)